MIRARRAAVRFLLLMMVGSVALPAILFAYASWLNYRSLNRIVDERIDHSLAVLQEQTLKVFQSIELAITTTTRCCVALGRRDQGE